MAIEDIRGGAQGALSLEDGESSQQSFYEFSRPRNNEDAPLMPPIAQEALNRKLSFFDHCYSLAYPKARAQFSLIIFN